MKLISYLIVFLTVTVLSVITYFQLNKIISPCDTTILYTIDSIDPRFEVTKQELIAVSAEAALMWNSAAGKPLIKNSPDGDLDINMIFDERQSQLSKIDNLESRVDLNIQNIDLANELFDQEIADFQKRANELNEEVKKWNSQGGAPPDIYKQLTQRNEDLNRESKELNEKAAILNRNVATYNSQVGDLNQAVESFNTTLEEKPEGGIFLGEEFSIEIYVNDGRADLVRLVAHEMGHAIGISHVVDPYAIMFPQSNDQTELTNQDVSALNEVCEGEKVIDLFIARFN